MSVLKIMTVEYYSRFRHIIHILLIFFKVYDNFFARKMKMKVLNMIGDY